MLRSWPAHRDLSSHEFGSAVLSLLLALSALATAATPATAAAGTTSPVVARADTGLTVLPDLIIGADGPRRATAAQIEIGELLVESRDPAAVVDLGPLLPATRVITNSRGESHFMVRGAPERHLRLWLNGLPLAVPWDERADLSMVPALAVARVQATRGPTSALAGNGTLAGTVNVATAPRPAPARRTRVVAEVGEVAAYQIAAGHRQRAGSWQLTAAASHRDRDGVTLPADLDAPFNQQGDVRTNSDLRQTALLLAADRALRGDGSLDLTLLATDGAKGVPPETHIADARFWRLPLQRRLLTGGRLDTALGESRRWRLDATASLDLFAQDIRPFDDATYTGPPLEEGADFERNRDVTGYSRLRIVRVLGPLSSVAVQAEARYTRHVESLTVGGPELAYAQWLGGVTAEADLASEGPWRGVIGGGWDFAATPESGDKPERAATHASVAVVRLERRLGSAVTAYGTMSRRSRFPSLRELYSGALGRFVPNPDLSPERQDLAEIGLSAGGRRWDAGAGGFVSYLADGIEKVALPGPETRFQRVNRTRIRTYGVEVLASWAIGPGLSLSGHHTILDSRVQEDGSYDRPAEDRPQYLTTLAARWEPFGGWSLATEYHLLGPRHSADSTAADGLRRLPAQSRWDLRLGWTAYEPLGGITTIEAFLRLENALDSVIDVQTGLPAPGRTWRAGVSLRLGSG